ncbi:hypothetical protein FJR38_26390 [Anabaena sp. UHCC 0253]|uniref:NB-ARC domain-containing protein n=1 Tax=Anabaena sp. UHCC 0253 TaxID=2590019 RepID=UPI001444C73A|nr:NB-ARC domain-containing protein [Anabaena sp. UHCC 0253]MTJ55935.1 hypothetical protein [Anabaena sp. UHCC 0253]
MAHPTLTASEVGQQKIQEAIDLKKWKVSQEDIRPLVAASLKHIEQYQAGNQLGDNDLKWLENFEKIFYCVGDKERKEEDKKAKRREIKAEIIKSSGDTLLEKIEKKIRDGEIYVHNISGGTWVKFAKKSKRESVNETAFKLYCDILGLPWQEIAENKLNIVILENQVNDDNSEILNIEVKPSINLPLQNLPHSSYIEFFGRQRKLPLLKKQLSLSNNIYAISIIGIGGVGKTSLILEAANYCLKVSEERSDENYQYDAIIFSTFKQKEITTEEIIRPSHKQELSHQQIFNDILSTFARKELLKLDFNNCMDATLDLLKDYKTLLIIDNLETVEDIKDIIWFLHKLPKSVKVVITSRKITDFGVPIPIDTLSPDSGLQLIRHRAELQNVHLNHKQEKNIYHITCGIPLAIVLIIGQIAYHHSPEYVLENFSAGNNHIVDYCFESSIKPLKGKSSYKLLSALALLFKITSDHIIIEIANLTDKEEIEQGFTQLKKLNLIQRMGNKYEVLSIIRSYILAELKNDLEWEKELRNRWVNWYYEFVEQYGGQNEKEWHNYQDLEKQWENITDVISWCINQNRYDDVKYFWQQIKGYSYLRGYQSNRLTNWNSRLEWTDWLIEKAKNNKDYATAVEVMFDKAWTLTLIEKPEKLNEAIKLFAQVRRMKKHHNPMFEIDVAIDISYLYIIQQKINKSQKWLNKAKQLLTKVQAAEASHSRQFIIWNFYQGWVFF